MNKVAISLWILIFAIVLMSIPTKCKNKEGFYTYRHYKKYCPSCGNRSSKNCGKCTNCGTCVTPNGQSECVPGDSSGPYFRKDCHYWIYGTPNYGVYGYGDNYYGNYNNLLNIGIFPLNIGIFPSNIYRKIYPHNHRYKFRNPQRWRARNKFRYY